MKDCTVVASAKLCVPSKKLLGRFLKENGYSGSVGVDVLHENYGEVISCDTSGVCAFFGIHAGIKSALMSRFSLGMKFVVGRISMNAGFYNRKDLQEYERFQSIRSRMGKSVEVDAIGYIAHSSEAINVNNHRLNGPPGWWLGYSDRGWLKIDSNFFLVEIYESLPWLLAERNGMELSC